MLFMFRFFLFFSFLLFGNGVHCGPWNMMAQHRLPISLSVTEGYGVSKVELN